MSGRRGNVPPPASSNMSLCGTPEYMAPEILNSGLTCESCDWWSLGCLVCELLTGWTPFACDNQDIQSLVKRIIHDPISLPSHPHIGTVEREFIEALLVRHPEDRLGARPFGASAIMQHPFFRGHTPEEFLTKQLQPPYLPATNGAPDGVPSSAHSQVDGVLAVHAQGQPFAEAAEMRAPTNWNGEWEALEQLWGSSVHLSFEDEDAADGPQAADEEATPAPPGTSTAAASSDAKGGPVDASPVSITDTPLPVEPSPRWSAT